MLQAVSDVLSESRRLQTFPIRFMIPPVALSGIVLTSVFAMVYGDPKWLLGTAALGVVYATFTWQLVGAT